MTSRVLFTVAVLILVALPAAVLAQGGVEAGWTDSPPTLDGDRAAGEWAAATRVALSTLGTSEAAGFALPELDALGLLPDAVFEGEVSPSQATGWLYLMNDARNLYLAVTMDVGAPAGWPDQAATAWVLVFEDEPVIGDGLWAADLCSEDPDEGQLASGHAHGPQFQADSDTFVPVAEEGTCHSAGVADPPGYQRALGYGPLTIETRIHLSNSALQAVPGECVNLGLVLSNVEWHGEGQWVGVGFWPADLVGAVEADLPDALAEVCLAEEPVVEEEEFVPELGSLALLGSGLMGLAGYAGLRWRSRREA